MIMSIKTRKAYNLLKYLKEFFVIFFGTTALMLLAILCISLFIAPWFLAMFLETKGASSSICFLTVISMYASYYTVGRSFGLIDDPKIC
tara:strand:- start:233 stop:499 length:267 start_codon:yes stop_codon:yes gene_type:complete